MQFPFLDHLFNHVHFIDFCFHFFACNEWCYHNAPSSSTLSLNSLCMFLLIIREKIVVPSTKPFITFQGAGMKKTVLVWHDTAGEAGGTGLSASTFVQSAHFIAQDLTFAV